MHEIILRACFTGADAESQAQDLKAQIDPGEEADKELSNE